MLNVFDSYVPRCTGEATPKIVLCVRKSGLSMRRTSTLYAAVIRIRSAVHTSYYDIIAGDVAQIGIEDGRWKIIST